MAPDVASVNRPLWAAFDCLWYSRVYRTSLEGVELTPGTIEDFYHQNGVKSRHSPNPFFDEAWYLSVNPDVQEAVTRGEFASGFEHYGLVGHQDRSPHWLFCEAFYLSQNDDLTADSLAAGHYVNGYDHYLRVGDAEYRTGHWLFDPHMHRAAMLRLAVPNEQGDAVGEFTRFITGDRQIGSSQRLSWYFDPIWYLANYPEVQDEIESGMYSSALEHYLCNSTPSNFSPNAHFSEEFYRESNPDVLSLVERGELRNCFEHFVKWGAVERRRPHSTINLEAYFQNVVVQTEIGQGFHRDAFAHLEASCAATGTERAPELTVREEEGRLLYTLSCKNLVSSLVRRPLDFSYEAPALSVIIVAHNRFDFTMATLASLRQNYAPSIQVILVDSGSNDDISRIEKYITGLNVLRFRYNLGFVAGCNAALKAVKSDTTLYLNNDVQLAPGAIQNAMDRLWSSDSVGAVGAKLILPHGKLQEAGSIIWRDGWCTGYLRNEDPNLPEANFVRPVDFCSAAFLLCKSRILRELGGFDSDYSPAYFEEADLAIRMRKAGFTTIYDPAVVVNHFERATGNGTLSNPLMHRNQPVFRRKNAEFLRRQYFNTPGLATTARAAAQGQRRILFIEDRLPFRDLGSGFVRSNDILRALAEMGYHVTLYPIFRAVETPAEINSAFPDTVEIIHDRELRELDSFLAARSNYFDLVWIARTHNAERLAPVFSRAAVHFPADHVVLDTEALASLRHVERAKVLHTDGLGPAGKSSPSLSKMIQNELSCAFISQTIVAVNQPEAKLIEQAGFANVHVLGHAMTISPSTANWADRRGLLFLGAIPDENSPNLDALTWFSSEVLPILEDRLDPDATLAVAGRFSNRIDFTPLRRNRRVQVLGRVADLASVFAKYRVFVAPTRFAAGIPYKIHEAAAHGLPIVASELLARQVNWLAGQDIAVGSVEDPRHFADAIVQVYENESTWRTLQANALARIRNENDPSRFKTDLARIIESALS